MAKRINVGLLVSTIHNEFDETIIEGVMQGAKELDCNLIIVPGHYINADYNDKVRTKNKYQYNSLFSYINKNNIDVLLVSLGTIANTLSEEEKKEFLSMYQGIPITLVACSLDGYSSICFDNTSGLRDGINDLIHTRNCKKICMVSGPVTNVDARERLAVYKEVLSENNLPIDEKQIVYGNFSKYCTQQVEELLQNNPDVDAIVFANDAMASGGYDVIKAHNLTIGEDIYVMGFDDTPSSVSMIPHLTSVRADGTLLGKEAIFESINNMQSKTLYEKKVKTSLVKRSSTGYSDNLIVKNFYNKEFDTLLKNDSIAASKLIFENFVGNNIYRRESDFYEKYFISLVSGLFNQVRDDLEPVILPELRNNIDLLFDTVYGKRITFTECLQVSELIRQIAIACYPEKENYINELAFIYVTYASKRIVANNNTLQKEMAKHMWLSNTIARDMLYYNDDELKGYATVVDKFGFLGFNNALLYSLDSPFLFDEEHKISGWSRPDSFKLKSYSFEENTVNTVDKELQKIDSNCLYNNQFVPLDRRFTFIMDLIYSYDELLGMMLIGVSDFTQIKYIDSLMAQVCSACKHLSTYNAYKDVQSKLEKTLDELKNANKELASISVTDELTGILNRRGFFEKVKKLISINENKGRNCEMIFCDMDNLKLINDQFGHDEGDYALRNSANILNKAIGQDGVISRIGGDEFAAFAFIDSNESDICSVILDECNQYNSQSDKPYYVELSTGSVTFINEEGIDVNKKLDEADDILYQNKRYKRKNVLKK